MITAVSSREFNRDADRAMDAARRGPVFIIDCGRPVHVLLSIGDYRKLAGPQTNIVELLAMKEGDEIAFDPLRLGEGLQRSIKF